MAYIVRIYSIANIINIYCITVLVTGYGIII